MIKQASIYIGSFGGLLVVYEIPVLLIALFITAHVAEKIKYDYLNK